MLMMSSNFKFVYEHLKHYLYSRRIVANISGLLVKTKTEKIKR